MNRLFIFSALFVLLFACKKDEVKVTVNADASKPSLINPTSTLDAVFTADNLSDTLTIGWVKTGYGVATQVNYQVEMDSKCGTFAAPVIVGSSVGTTLPISMGDFNTKLLNNLKIAHNQQTEIQLRVTSTINGQQKVISDPVTFKVTPFSTKPTALWMGENSPSAPVLYATTATTYEGYKYVTAGLSFHLTNTPVCADVFYGANGAGLLTSGETSPEIVMGRTGYYKINVDLAANKFDTLFIATWGMIGSATPLSWDGSTPMTYNSDNGKWEGIISLAQGALKFRANNAWDLNYGPAVIADHEGFLIQTNDAIDIPVPGTYLVSIDFSQSSAPYGYTYSVEPSADVPEPKKLWLPGGYEGFNPAAAPTIYAINDNVYEGYVNIPQGTGFKFTSNPDYSHTNYGDSGTPGVLTTDGTATDLSLPTAGYWKLTADIKNLTYSTTLVNTWGIIGTATPGQWASSTAMTYDATKDVWTITLDLVNGALKFRANNDWGLNYGPAVINDLQGQLVTTNDAISVPEDGNYTVTLDFSRSKAPYQYAYKVVKN